MDRVERRAERGRDPVEVLIRQVAAADDEVDVAEPLARAGSVRRPVDDVAEGEQP